MLKNIFIGTSGWQYNHWRQIFYEDIPKKAWLSFYTRHFNTLEVNATFYRLQEKDTFRKWVVSTPADFQFAIKANRYLTHNKKLLEPEASITIEKDRAEALGDKLAVVLWQLPSNLQQNLLRLECFLKCLAAWKTVRHSIEFRHPSWFDQQTANLLSHHRVAVCQSDAADWPLWSAVTTDLVYIRLHGHSQTYVSHYSNASLSGWAEKINHWNSEGRKIYVYFDNDANAAAPMDALALKKIIHG